MSEDHSAVLADVLTELESSFAISAGRLPPRTRRIEQLLGKLSSPSIVAYLVNTELEGASADPERFEPRWMGSEITLHSAASFRLAMSLIDTDPRLPFTSTADAFMSPCNPGASLGVRCFALPEGQDIDVFNDGARPFVLWEREVSQGEWFHVEAGQGLHLSIDRDLALMSVSAEDRLQSSWYFDPQTLAPTAVHASSVNAAMLQTMADFLGSYGDESCIASLTKLTKHPAHFVRYSAAREILRLSLDEGWAAFVDMADDHHPHLRRAAATVMERLRTIREEANG